MIGKKESRSRNVHMVFITLFMTIFCKTGGGDCRFSDIAGWLCTSTAPVILFRDHMVWGFFVKKKKDTVWNGIQRI